MPDPIRPTFYRTTCRWMRGWGRKSQKRWDALIRGNNELKARKKRLGLFSPRRLGSPPPELPNHEMDTKELLIVCKRHFGNGDFPLVDRSGIDAKRNSAGGLLLLMPGLAVVAGHPNFAGGVGDPAMLRVGKFHANNVASKRSVRFRGHDSRPMISRVERMIEHRSGPAGPNFRAEGRDSSEDDHRLRPLFFPDLLRLILISRFGRAHVHILPRRARVIRPLQTAAGTNGPPRR